MVRDYAADKTSLLPRYDFKFCFLNAQISAFLPMTVALERGFLILSNIYSKSARVTPYLPARPEKPPPAARGRDIFEPII